MIIRFFNILSFFILPLSLISCGGGGGGSSSNNNTQSETQTETLTASFSIASNSGELPFEVSVDASSSTLAESYSWDFGDGNSATGVTSTNTYTAKGNYTITLTVSDATGAIDSDNQVITVLNPTISGTMSAPETSVADSDTADPNVSVSNNGFDEAQQALVIRFLESKGYDVNTADLRPRVLACAGILGAELGFLSPSEIPRIAPGVLVSETEVDAIVSELKALASSFKTKETEVVDLDEEIAESVADASHNITRVKSKIDRVDDLRNRLRG